MIAAEQREAEPRADRSAEAAAGHCLRCNCQERFRVTDRSSTLTAGRTRIKRTNSRKPSEPLADADQDAGKADPKRRRAGRIGAHQAQGVGEREPGQDGQGAEQTDSDAPDGSSAARARSAARCRRRGSAEHDVALPLHGAGEHGQRDRIDAVPGPSTAAARPPATEPPVSAKPSRPQLTAASA